MEESREVLTAPFEDSRPPSRRKVVVRELISIAGWGTLIAVLAGAGIELLLH